MGQDLLRDGDVVCGRGVVRGVSIEWEIDTVTVERPRLQVGDTVSWHDRNSSERSFGEVLAIDDAEVGGTVYVWIRERGKWPRVTRAATELRRESRA